MPPAAAGPGSIPRRRGGRFWGACRPAAVRGRPGIDPEAAVRVMLAGMLLGIVHDRRLMREAAVNTVSASGRPGSEGEEPPDRVDDDLRADDLRDGAPDGAVLAESSRC